MKIHILIVCLILMALSTFAQSRKEPIPLVGNKNQELLHVAATEETYHGRPSLKVVNAGTEGSEATFVKLIDTDFRNGTIEVDLAGQPGAGASDQARGFVGVAFRIAADNSTFECFYLRPTNGRASDQVRRNHSAQYISYPDFPWHKLRKEFPEQYETYVDLVPGEWTKVRIEVEGGTARLYVHDSPQPTLIVNDLKLGTNAHGSIGLWIGPGTEAHFANLVLTHR
jgi:hypothetical protein